MVKTETIHGMELPTPPDSVPAEEEQQTATSRPKRGPKVATAGGDDEPKPTPKKRVPRKSAAKVKAEAEDVHDAEELLQEVPKVTPRKRTKKAASPSDSELSEFKEDPSDAETTGTAEPATPSGKPKKEKKERKKTPKKSRIAKEEPEFDSEGNEIPKKARKAKVYEKVIYDIPDVEKKTTTFKGQSATHFLLWGNRENERAEREAPMLTSQVDWDTRA
jgi:UV DNA damage endonuclease